MVWNFAMTNTNKNQKQMTRSNPPGTKSEVSRFCFFHKYSRKQVCFRYLFYKYKPFGTKSEVCCLQMFMNTHKIM